MVYGCEWTVRLELHKSHSILWYLVLCRNGKLNWNFTDLFQYFGTWYYIRGGVLDWNYTGLAYHAGGITTLIMVY